MFQCIVFDLDGTLLDTLPALASAGNHICRKHGWPEKQQWQYKGMIGGSLHNFVSQLLPESARSEAFIEETSREMISHYTEHCQGEIAPFPFLPELLARIKQHGTAMCVLTNTADHVAKRMIQRCYGDLFSYIQGACLEVPQKPAPDMLFRLQLEMGGVPEKDILLVGDSEVDIQTAHNAGVSCCGVTWGYRERQSLERANADFLVDSVDELTAVILRSN